MIETHHLSKLYSRGLYALRDLSMTVDKGEFVFLTGPSGAGKSTFLRLLLMQERPSEGEIFVNGYNLMKFPLIQRKAVLRKLIPDNDGWIRFADHVEGSGVEFFNAVSQTEGPFRRGLLRLCDMKYHSAEPVLRLRLGRR